MEASDKGDERRLSATAQVKFDGGRLGIWEAEKKRSKGKIHLRTNQE
jgi:hypothetical protein